MHYKNSDDFSYLKIFIQEIIDDFGCGGDDDDTRGIE